ncbi:MAG TPA: hypothetical protein VLV78_07595 [Thermoanaerobaculia bacterium]|nr:hypothetical protein [Thermoanaerobaculia bacterium]
MTEVAVAAAEPASEKRFAAALQHRFFLRLHMTAMLAATLLAGIVTTRFLASAGLGVLWFRYALAVTVAYAVFVTSVKLWLWYIGLFAAAAQRRASKSGGNWLDGFDFSSGGSSSSSSGGSSSFDTGGGRFGGGGATGSWGSAVFSSKGSGGGGSSSGGGDSDLGELFLVVLVIVVVLAVVAAFVWVIWAAPTILGETAFNAILAGTLTKHARNASRGSWVGSIVRRTFLPFVAILALSIALGGYAQHYCPGATRLMDAVHCAAPAQR